MELNNVKTLVFNHFKQRLKERYKIDITYKQYLSLSFNESLFSHVYIDKRKKNVVLFKHEEQWILAVRDKKGYLITCLPIQKLNKILIEKL
jgi:hypothetical protein